MRPGLVALVLRLLGMATWAAIGAVTARFLSVSERGEYAAAALGVTALGLVGGSLGSAAGHYVARREEGIGAVARTAAKLGLALGTAFALVGGAVVALTTGETMAILVALAVVPAVLRGALSQLLLAQDRTIPYMLSAYTTAYLGLALIAGWLAFPGHRTPEDAMAMWMLAHYGSVAVLLFWGRHWWRVGTAGSPGLTKGLARFAAPAMGGSVVGFLNARADLFLVAAFAGAAEAGLYSAATAGAEVLLAFSSSVPLVLYRRIASSTGEEAAEWTVRGARRALGIAGAGGLCAMLAAPLAITIVFGERYEPATNALRVLAIATTVFAPQAVFGMYFEAHAGRPAVGFALRGAMAATDIVLCVLLIPVWGITGAAFACLASYGLGTVLYLIMFRRTTGTPARRLIRWAASGGATPDPAAFRANP